MKPLYVLSAKAAGLAECDVMINGKAFRKLKPGTYLSWVHVDGSITRVEGSGCEIGTTKPHAFQTASESVVNWRLAVGLHLQSQIDSFHAELPLSGASSTLSPKFRNQLSAGLAMQTQLESNAYLKPVFSFSQTDPKIFYVNNAFCSQQNTCIFGNSVKLTREWLINTHSLVFNVSHLKGNPSIWVSHWEVNPGSFEGDMYLPDISIKKIIDSPACKNDRTGKISCQFSHGVFSQTIAIEDGVKSSNYLKAFAGQKGITFKNVFVNNGQNHKLSFDMQSAGAVNSQAFSINLFPDLNAATTSTKTPLGYCWSGLMSQVKFNVSTSAQGAEVSWALPQDPSTSCPS